MTTHIINILIYKFSAKLSLDTTLIMSKSGKFLYLVIRSDIKDLKGQAEKIGFNVQMGIGATDLISLEPVDDKGIPF